MPKTDPVPMMLWLREAQAMRVRHGIFTGLASLASDLLLIAEDGALEAPLRERYAAWDLGEAKKLLAGEVSLPEIERRVSAGVNPEPRSGKQELLENIVNQSIWGTER